ncbi:hypothetical protein ACFQ34_16765 [Pseudonocardia benzenivorans]|jgi:hypothetical protein|uniref:Uncharacterized protein n=2 Tax=Pseudonocardia TaxID=1847 RepID=F4D244_PSEUX|nr:hypothetical protein Psed_5989 [Pseudonocardia dioxanivorans CB1190]GJF06192.1 hypothetical protein PSD17_51400 [Pseudonocardia sp. D17]
MAQPAGEPGPLFLRSVSAGRPGTGGVVSARVGDRAGVLLAVLRAEVEAAVDRGVVTRGEGQEVLARLAIVVDQAVHGR